MRKQQLKKLSSSQSEGDFYNTNKTKQIKNDDINNIILLFHYANKEKFKEMSYIRPTIISLHCNTLVKVFVMVLV